MTGYSISKVQYNQAGVFASFVKLTNKLHRGKIMAQKQSLQFATLALFAITAHADEVLLKNGDKITGTVINKSDNQLEMKTDYADKVVIKWDAVQTLKSDKPITLILKDKQELTGIANTAADGTMTLKSDGVYNTQPIPLANITEINKKFFTGAVNVGGALADGNTTRQAYHGDANVTLRGRDDKVNLGGQYNYADSEDSATNVTTLNARNFQLFGTYSHFFTEKWYGYANGLFTNDRLQNIQLRSAFGVGAGYAFFDTDDLHLSLEAGPAYVNTSFYRTPFNCTGFSSFIADPAACKPLDDTSGIAGRWFLNYDQFILSHAVQLFHYHEGIVDSNFYLRSATGFHVPIWNGLQFTNQVQVDYYNGYQDPTSKTTDVRYLFSLGYGW